MISQRKAARLIRTIGERAFVRVTFIKRSDGSVREMTCRLGVKKHLKGGPPAYDPKKHDLLWVWEPGDKGGYKSIPIEGIIKLKAGGQEFDVQIDP